MAGLGNNYVAFTLARFRRRRRAINRRLLTYTCGCAVRWPRGWRRRFA